MTKMEIMSIKMLMEMMKIIKIRREVKIFYDCYDNM